MLKMCHRSQGICSKVHYSSVTSSHTVTPSEDQIDEVDKALTVVLIKTKNSKDVVGLTLQSKDIQLGEQLSKNDNDTLPLAENRKYSLILCFQ